MTVDVKEQIIDDSHRQANTNGELNIDTIKPLIQGDGGENGDILVDKTGIQDE